MTPQEKDLLTTLLDRLKNAPRQDKDPEADALIRQATASQSDLPYYLVQTVLIQDLSLHQAQQRISDLEKQLAEAQQAAKPSATSFLGGLFGHQAPAPSSAPAPAGPWTRSPQVAAAPPAQPYAQPGYQPQQQGYGQPAGGGLLGGGGAGGGRCRRRAVVSRHLVPVRQPLCRRPDGCRHDAGAWRDGCQQLLRQRRFLRQRLEQRFQRCRWRRLEQRCRSGRRWRGLRSWQPGLQLRSGLG